MKTEIKVEIVPSNEDIDELYLEISRYEGKKRVGDVVQWPILDEEVWPISRACIDYLDDNARTSNYKFRKEESDDGRSGKGIK